MKNQLHLFALAIAMGSAAWGSSIPEPGLILYGAVSNSANDQARVTTGYLTWNIQPQSGGSLALVTPLSDINGMFSYRLRVPFESAVGGNTVSANVFAFPSSLSYYTNGVIKLVSGGNEYHANPFNPTNWQVLQIGALARGSVKEINLSVNASGLASPGAATNPLNGNAALANFGDGRPPELQFTYVVPQETGGIYLQWIGAPTNKSYMLIRAQSIGAELSKHELVKEFPPSPATSNYFLDTNVVNTTTYFYRLIAQ